MPFALESVAQCYKEIRDVRVEKEMITKISKEEADEMNNDEGKYRR